MINVTQPVTTNGEGSSKRTLTENSVEVLTGDHLSQLISIVEKVMFPLFNEFKALLEPSGPSSEKLNEAINTAKQNVYQPLLDIRNGKQIRDDDSLRPICDEVNNICETLCVSSGEDYALTEAVNSIKDSFESIIIKM